MLEEHKAEKLTIMAGIATVAIGCFMLHPIFGVLVAGIATVIFGLFCWSLRI